MTLKERVETYCKHAKIRISAFERRASLSNGYFNQVKKEPSPSKLSNIEEAFPDLNPIWLLTGEGPMLKYDIGATRPDNNSINPTNTQAMDASIALDYIATLKEQLATMREQLKEKDALIRQLTQKGSGEVLSRSVGAVKEKQDELTDKL